MKIAPIGELAPPPTPPDPPETEAGFNPELIQLAGCNGVRGRGELTPLETSHGGEAAFQVAYTLESSACDTAGCEDLESQMKGNIP